MKKILRLIGIVAAASVLATATVVALSVVGSGLLHHSASAEEVPLLPITSTPQTGSTVYAADGRTVLATLQASQLRKPVPLSAVSKTMITALLDTEDHRFYLHGGFDVQSMVRALANDSSGSNGLQGGSTIAQQLVKQIYLSPARTVARKVKEAVLADRLERQYSKNQILQAYLNTIYLGNSAYGVEAAAETYFREPAAQLGLPQAALLAGMISNPSGYDPILQPEAARNRRAQVLSRMVYYHDITQAQADAADASPLPTLAPPPATSDAISNYYVQEVRNELLADGSPLGSTYDQRYQTLFEGGLKIYTNLQPSMQAQAEQTVAADTPANSGGFRQALVSIDPTTGKVLALVGGSGTQSSQFDIITQGTRQPGSGFKLFTLLAALQQGYSIYDTLDGQSPCAIDFPTDHDLVKTPARNDEGNGGGVLQLLDATAQSTNCAYIRLAHEVGLNNVISMAHSLGISENLPEYPSIVIGSIAVHPLEMAAAYAAVADGGVYHQPSFIGSIVDRAGDTIYSGGHPGKRVVSTQIAAEADVALSAVVQYGTGTAAALYDRPVAGKTGTTNNNIDAWFNGFTPQLETTVWMGNVADEVPMNDVGGIAVYGGTYPARTWHDYSAAVLAPDPAVAFPVLDDNLLPPSKYVTSPSLVAADVLDHNAVGYSSCGSAYYPVACSPGPVTPAKPTSPTTASARTPATGVGGTVTTVPAGTGGGPAATTPTPAAGAGPAAPGGTAPGAGH